MWDLERHRPRRPSIREAYRFGSDQLHAPRENSSETNTRSSHSTWRTDRESMVETNTRSLYNTWWSDRESISPACQKRRPNLLKATVLTQPYLYSVCAEMNLECRCIHGCRRLNVRRVHWTPCLWGANPICHFSYGVFMERRRPQNQ